LTYHRGEGYITETVKVTINESNRKSEVAYELSIGTKIGDLE